MPRYTLKEGHTYEAAPESQKDQAEAITFTDFEILENGRHVGVINKNNYFGYARGILHGKKLPDISSYRGREVGVSLEDRLEAFVQSKTGQKFLKSIGRAGPEM